MRHILGRARLRGAWRAERRAVSGAGVQRGERASEFEGRANRVTWSGRERQGWFVAGSLRGRDRRDRGGKERQEWGAGGSDGIPPEPCATADARSELGRPRLPTLFERSPPARGGGDARWRWGPATRRPMLRAHRGVVRRAVVHAEARVFGGAAARKAASVAEDARGSPPTRRDEVRLRSRPGLPAWAWQLLSINRACLLDSHFEILRYSTGFWGHRIRTDR